MCESRISSKCSGERATRLGDGRSVCPACAPYTTDTGPEHDLPLDPQEACGQPRNFSWDMTAPAKKAARLQQPVPIQNFDPGHPRS
jgi:hypothetical protein